MNRRAFLQLLTTGAIGAGLAESIDLERLLWTPKPIITVPAMPKAMGMSVRFVREWDALLSKHVNRFGVVYGFGVIQEPIAPPIWMPPDWQFSVQLSEDAEREIFRQTA